MAQDAACRVAQVETDVVVPVEEVSNKAEYAARLVMNATVPRTDKAAFLEQLIVRREMAMNFVYFTPNYDSY